MLEPKILGIDTSNYKTSVALCDLEGSVVGDERKLLKVKEGERGLRQSDALFQHVENLPGLLEKLLSGTEPGSICGICVSSRPRPVEGSYMPCFNAGLSQAKSLAAALKVPLWLTSHQEGHIAAIANGMELPSRFLTYHLSGGTCELLLVSEKTDSDGKQNEVSNVKQNEISNVNIDEIANAAAESNKIEIVGGSKDISFGQLLDRVGVALGMQFPAGEEMDRIAMAAAGRCGGSENMALGASKSDYKPCLTDIKVTDAYFNISGIETQAQRIIDKLNLNKQEINNLDTETDSSDLNEASSINEALKTNDASALINSSVKNEESLLILEIFDKIAKTAFRSVEQACGKYGVDTVLFAGGVSSSKYISEKIKALGEKQGINIVFGDQRFSSDNAAGVALIGLKSFKSLK